MRAYHGKVEVVSPGGDHVRYVPSDLARAMVAAEIATVHNANGKVKSVKLLETANSHAQRIGEPTGASMLGTRFVEREWLDTGQRVWKHHPRAMYPAPE